MAEIGARLRDARMGAGCDIDAAETRTKIRAKYLRAMENEEWDLLPGEVYVRSFLRTYGAFLGLDTRQLLDDYRREHESPTDHEPPPIAPPSRERDGRARGGGGRRPRIAPWLATVVVLAAVIAALILIGRHNGSSPTNGGHATPPVARTGHRGRARSRRAPAHRVPARPRVVRLSLVPTGTVYVCLVDGHGHAIIPGRIFSPGETIPTATAAKLVLILGNASATVTANGVPVPIRASAGAIDYAFTPGHHALLPAADQPACT